MKLTVLDIMIAPFLFILIENGFHALKRVEMAVNFAVDTHSRGNVARSEARGVLQPVFAVFGGFPFFYAEQVGDCVPENRIAGDFAYNAVT
jgi:hypothetical protein